MVIVRDSSEGGDLAVPEPRPAQWPRAGTLEWGDHLQRVALRARCSLAADPGKERKQECAQKLIEMSRADGMTAYQLVLIGGSYGTLEIIGTP